MFINNSSCKQTKLIVGSFLISLLAFFISFLSYCIYHKEHLPIFVYNTIPIVTNDYQVEVGHGKTDDGSIIPLYGPLSNLEFLIINIGGPIKNIEFELSEYLIIEKSNKIKYAMNISGDSIKETYNYDNNRLKFEPSIKLAQIEKEISNTLYNSTLNFNSSIQIIIEMKYIDFYGNEQFDTIVIPFFCDEEIDINECIFIENSEIIISSEEFTREDAWKIINEFQNYSAD